MSSREEKNKEKQLAIEEEKKRERRIKIFKLTIKIFIICLTLFFIMFFYTKYSSTTGIIVKETRIKSEKIPESFNGIKIIQFSDLYYGSTIFDDEVKNLVKIINKRKPDIVIFTGNLIDKNYSIKIEEQEKLINELKKINSTIGKYAVSGKNDNDKFSVIMNQSEFNVLDNNYDLIYNKDNNPILITGLSSLINKKRDINNSYRYFKEETHNSNIYSISIMSETDDLDDIISEYPNDLVLAGNSLNGEIRIPGIGGLISQSGSKKYKNPYYKLNNTKVFVSSGIGSPDVGFRLFARPSINFFRLTNKK